MSKPGEKDSRKDNPLKYVGIIGGLAVLAFILSPISPLFRPISPAPVEDANPVDCTSISQSVEYVIAGGRLESISEDFPEAEQQESALNMTSQERLALVTLLDVYCNRPELVQTISTAYDPAVKLVAYGCDAASGKIGDKATQEAAAPHRQIYCSSATKTIEYEVVRWTDTIDSFKTEVIDVAREQLTEDRDSTRLVDEAETILEGSRKSVQSAQLLLDSGLVYDAANELDSGISSFTSLIEREDLSALLES